MRLWACAICLALSACASKTPANPIPDLSVTGDMAVPDDLASPSDMKVHADSAHPADLPLSADMSLLSCAGLAATCGASGNESCCDSPVVTGGVFLRSDDVGDGGADAGSYNDPSDPATISDSASTNTRSR